MNTITGTVDYHNGDGDPMGDDPKWIYVDLEEAIEVVVGKRSMRRTVDRVAIASFGLIPGPEPGSVVAVNKKGIPVNDARWVIGRFEAYKHIDDDADVGSSWEPSLNRILSTWSYDGTDEITIELNDRVKR